jgi:hypothetical protein
MLPVIASPSITQIRGIGQSEGRHRRIGVARGRLVCVCYSPYRMTMTTGAAVSFRFRRTKNRPRDPYPGGRARGRTPAETGQNRGRFGVGSNPFVAVSSTLPHYYDPKPQRFRGFRPCQPPIITLSAALRALSAFVWTFRCPILVVVSLS